MCDDKTTIRAADRIMHQKVLHETVTFFWRLGGVNVITSTEKPQNSIANSTVPVTVLLRMISQSSTRVFGPEEKLFFKGALIADYSLEFHAIRNILIFSHPASPL